MESKSKINFTRWLILFAVLLAAVPAMIFLEQRSVAKGIGVVTLLVTVFAIRRWMYVIRKRSKVSLNLNDRYWMNENIPFYSELSKGDKKVFEDRVALFISEIIVTEIGKEVPERETCLYVAASGVVAFWGLPFWNYGRLTEVLVYPNNFTEDNQIDRLGAIEGKVHDGGLMDTTMILSLPALIAGFKNDKDKRNVGVHEFAHLLDKADGRIDGLPDGMNDELRLKWITLFEQEFKHELNGSKDINMYAATGPIEFFAVLVEYYKESPDLLRRKHGDLYSILSDYFSTRE
jgi:Mlc titration factor MtfA (ptsG expression regulator)